MLTFLEPCASSMSCGRNLHPVLAMQNMALIDRIVIMGSALLVPGTAPAPRLDARAHPAAVHLLEHTPEGSGSDLLAGIDMTLLYRCATAVAPLL